MHDATDNAPIVCTLDASHIRRQMRLNPLPLLIAQPKQVLPHGPDPPKRISCIWNQDCFAVAAELMSFHPSHTPIAIKRLLVDFLEAHEGAPSEIILECDNRCGD
jgi:hypothetical protein